MLVVTQKDGDVIEIGPDIRIMVSHTRKGVVRLAIDAPREVEIKRLSAPTDPPPDPGVVGAEPSVVRVLHLPSSAVTARRHRPGRS